MKNKYLILALAVSIALLFLAGCAAPQEAPEEVKKPVSSPIAEPEPQPEPEADMAEPEAQPEPEPAKVPTKKVRELLQKHVGRVSSLRYMYQDQTIKPEEWETWIKGDRMHVKLRELDNIRDDVYVDNVYLNLAGVLILTLLWMLI